MEEEKVLQRLQRQCARMECCESAVFNKALKAMEMDREAAARILASLKKDKFVDDRRYAGAFAREKSSLQGWGAIKIRFALAAKGIDEGIIKEALEEIDPGKAEDKLDRIVAEKYRQIKEDPEVRLKLLKFALSRGYSYNEADSAVKKAMA